MKNARAFLNYWRERARAAPKVYAYGTIIYVTSRYVTLRHIMLMRSLEIVKLGLGSFACKFTFANGILLPGKEAGQVEDLVCLRGNNALQVKDLLPSFRAANSKGGPYRKRSHRPTTIQKSTSYLKSSINFQGENRGKDTSKPYNNYNVTIHLMCQSL